MIKLVKNEFFIYCKETRIESNRSFYGSFSLGPFDSGQSITIANALRRTLLSELKGLAITSAEIEGAFHEYSTLPGVRDSILDILLNLKDIVLKTENFGNKKRGTSYATTFKKTQIGYLKTRGPGIVTASELKLPPGIQCVDPEQYIATLSEEGILNIKLMINEGKNYVLQNSYSPNPNSYHREKPVPHRGTGGKKESFLGKELIGQSLAQRASLKKVVNNQKTSPLLPSLVKFVNKSGKEIGGTVGFRTYINFKRRRLWLHKRNLFKTSSLLLGNSAITKNFSTNKAVKLINSTEGFKTSLVLPILTKESFLCKQKAINPGLLVPVITMVRKMRSTFPFFLLLATQANKGRVKKGTPCTPPSVEEGATPYSPSYPEGLATQEARYGEEATPATSPFEEQDGAIFLKEAAPRRGEGTHSGFLPQKNMARKSHSNKKDNLFSFLLIKKGTLRVGVKSFFENIQKYKVNLTYPVQGLKNISLNSPSSFTKTEGELREGGAITATKAVSLVIDAVFMPVNKVNYIIETNEQSVMSSEKTSFNTSSTPFFGYGASKSKPLPIFTPSMVAPSVQGVAPSVQGHRAPAHSEQTVEKILSLPNYFGFAHQSEPFSSLALLSLAKQPLVAPKVQGVASCPPKGEGEQHPRKWEKKKLFFIDKKIKERASNGELTKIGIVQDKVPVSRKNILYKDGGFYFQKKKILPLPFPIYKSKDLLFSLNNFTKNNSHQISYFIRIGKKVASDGTCFSLPKAGGTSAFFVRNNIIIFQKKKNYMLSHQLRFLKSCVGTQSFLTFNKEQMGFENEAGSLQELKRAYPPVLEKEGLPQLNYPLYQERGLSMNFVQKRISHMDPSFFPLRGTRRPISNERRKKVFLKSAAAQTTKIIGTPLNNSSNTNILDFSLTRSSLRALDRNGTSLQNLSEAEEKGLFRNKMRLSDNQTKTPLKNNIILEIWTNGSIHPRQALYEACKNLLSLFSKLEKATPLAFPQRTPNMS